MLLQVIVAIAWLVWLCSGTTGVKQGFMVGALLVVGLAVKQFLDFYWKPKAAEAEKPQRGAQRPQPFSLSARSRRGSLPSPNWNVSRYGTDPDA
ncbi:MAG: hypothetical protein LAO07_20550 [Acidobacteriia bacterium]|nr:hypothetical protein [Terriglobia bacterium]